jgi:light-regulated signal transduction histidine kinase (bacteriophytochrome)
VANDGQTALSLHDKSVFTLVLVDIRLPDMSGMELIKKLSELSAGITFIIITGYASVDTAIEAAGQRDIAGYVTKPLAMDNLLYLVRQVVKRKEAEEARQQAYSELEKRVEERTKELAQSNRELTNINQELESFSYAISHDLRAPLRSIDGFSRILQEDYSDRLDEKGNDSLQRIRSAAQHVGMLVDGIVGLSHITRREVKWALVDLSSLVQTIAAELQVSQPQRQVEFIIAPGVTANGNIHLLRILLQNLLGNAWKFTGKHLKARIEFGTTQVDGEEAFFIRDNGAGFDMTYADKLFGIFQHLHAADEFPGIGVGLATVRRVAHHHGGRVWAEGKVEKGATFYFTL